MKKGFTLVELLIVVLIIGILATISIPYYRKTVETSKATDALAILNTIANANKMYALDNNNYATGRLDNNHILVQRKYITEHNWNAYQWILCACDPSGGNCGGCGGGCAGGGLIACGYNNTTVNPYNTWRYSIDVNGVCQKAGSGTPDCPSM